MNSISTLNSGLERFLCQKIDGVVSEDETYSVGDYYEAVRVGVSQELRKNNGIYFTGIEAARELIESAQVEWSAVRKVYDPACGSGDLLVACAKMLPVFDDLSATLSDWGQRLHGSDLHAELVRTTKLRLIFTAIEKGCNSKNLDLHDALSFFNNIEVRDSLVQEKYFSDCDLIVMNPPFNKEEKFTSSLKIKGHVNASMLFLEKAIDYLNSGEIVAILPDVLRSGTRYEEFREWMNDLVIGVAEPKGRFDRFTDIDVFFLSARKRKQSADGARPFTKAVTNKGGKVSDFFEVRVGPVVPHRSPKEGKMVPYIHARSVKPWEKKIEILERRAFGGTLFSPPFVVLRRTSSPSDQYRAVAAIIEGDESVAVENHLIVLKPRANDVVLNDSTLKFFMSDIVNNFLNDSIRCRHLTTSIVKEIPFVMELVNGNVD